LDLANQKREVTKATTQIEVLLRNIKQVRLDFAAKLKLQAESFIEFLNMEARLERERTAAAAKTSEDWLNSGDSASSLYPISPNSLNSANAMSTTTSYSGYTMRATGSYTASKSSYGYSASGSSASYGTGGYASTGYSYGSSYGASASYGGAASGGYSSSASAYKGYGFKELEEAES
jgi:hypothetical protein